MAYDLLVVGSPVQSGTESAVIEFIERFHIQFQCVMKTAEIAAFITDGQTEDFFGDMDENLSEQLIFPYRYSKRRYSDDSRFNNVPQADVSILQCGNLSGRQISDPCGPTSIHGSYYRPVLFFGNQASRASSDKQEHTDQSEGMPYDLQRFSFFPNSSGRVSLYKDPKGLIRWFIEWFEWFE